MLSKDARAEWKRLAAELERVGLLTRVDRSAFAGYCDAYARWKAAEQALDRLDLVMVAPSGYQQQRPNWLDEFLVEQQPFFVETGVTGSCRCPSFP